jgi:hypothetical protein
MLLEQVLLLFDRQTNMHWATKVFSPPTKTTSFSRSNVLRKIDESKRNTIVPRYDMERHAIVSPETLIWRLRHL